MNCIVILCDTLRRDHCGPYTGGRPLNQCWSAQQPDWVVPTPNMDRLATRGTVFNNAWHGSSPCMPARRDIYTGRYEFLERGWGPLAETDLDLPRQVSGEPNQSIHRMLSGLAAPADQVTLRPPEDSGQAPPQQPAAGPSPRISQLITDHFHLWEQGSGNYHMGYTGVEFIRGQEADNWRTDPIDFPCPPQFLHAKLERHYRHKALFQHSEKDTYPAQVFTKAAEWLKINHTYKDFYLHIDCFPPHEPWDAPEELVKMFDPAGYSVNGSSAGPYDKWDKHMSPRQLRNTQARYAAQVVLTDRWLGRLLDQMDALDLWKDTLVIFCSDHGTYNGDHGRIGKLQTHQHDAVAHIPFILVHPTLGHGQRRDQLVQLVDIYPTVLAAVDRPCPPDRHGVNLLPVLEDENAPTRDHAICGVFGQSVTITDGRWILHQAPDATNQPLHWHDYCLSRFMPGIELGPFSDGRRPAATKPWTTETWLSDKAADPNELTNLAPSHPQELRRMQNALRATLRAAGAPPEQLERLNL